MSILFIIDIVVVTVFLYQYFKEKDKFYRNLAIIISFVFANDIWRLLKMFYDFPQDKIILINKIAIYYSVAIFIVLIIFALKNSKEIIRLIKSKK
ncbi:MAG: hypothetical protein ABIE43_03905 [Patescibacteria group bacterium]